MTNSDWINVALIRKQKKYICLSFAHTSVRPAIDLSGTVCISAAVISTVTKIDLEWRKFIETHTLRSV